MADGRWGARSKRRLFRAFVWRRHDLVVVPGAVANPGAVAYRSERGWLPAGRALLSVRATAGGEPSAVSVHALGPDGPRLVHEMPATLPGRWSDRLLHLPPGAERIVLQPAAGRRADIEAARLHELGTVPLQVQLARQWAKRLARSPGEAARKLAGAAVVLVRRGPREASRQLMASQLLHQGRPGAVPSAAVVRRSRDLERARAVHEERWRRELTRFLAAGETVRLPSPAAPVVSILVVLYNRAELTLACLRSIAAHAGDACEVIVVDNASTDATTRLLDRVEGATVVRNDDNVGFLRACNQAAALARGAHLLLLNNDAELRPRTVGAALAVLADETVGVVGGPIIAPDGALQEAGCVVWADGSCLGYGRGDDPSLPPYQFRRDVDFVSGALLFTPRRVWDELGGFDEAFAPAYYEDTDYCMRVRASGLRVVYDPGVTVDHLEYGSSDAVAASEQMMRHRATFLATHAAALGRHLPRDAANVLVARTTDRHRPRVLVVDDRVPLADTGYGAPRAAALVRALVDLGYSVTFYPKLPVEGGWDSVRTLLPPDVEVMVGATIEGLGPFLWERRGYYHVVVVSRSHNMAAMRELLDRDPELLGGARLVYDAEAVTAVRDLEEQRLRGEAPPAHVAAATVAAELALCEPADAVMAVSPDERDLFAGHVGDHVHVVAHCLLPEPSPRPFDERSHLLFVGNLDREPSPNTDAVLWFLDVVYRRLRSELGAEAPELVVVGRLASTSLARRRDPGLHLVGSVADLSEPFDRARVFVAPTRFAAGIPHKVHEAAGRGVPVVATELLARQLRWTAGEHLLAAPTSDGDRFLAACLQLHTDPALWERIRGAALDRVAEDCAPDRFRASVAAALEP